MIQSVVFFIGPTLSVRHTARTTWFGNTATTPAKESRKSASSDIRGPSRRRFDNTYELLLILFYSEQNPHTKCGGTECEEPSQEVWRNRVRQTLTRSVRQNPHTKCGGTECEEPSHEVWTLTRSVRQNPQKKCGGTECEEPSYEVWNAQVFVGTQPSITAPDPTQVNSPVGLNRIGGLWLFSITDSNWHGRVSSVLNISMLVGLSWVVDTIISPIRHKQNWKLDFFFKNVPSVTISGLNVTTRHIERTSRGVARAPQAPRPRGAREAEEARQGPARKK